MNKTQHLLTTGALVLATAGTTLGFTGTATAADIQPASVAPKACTTGDIYLGPWYDHRGEVHYTKCRDNGYTRVTGWVKDDRADNRCIEAYADFTNNAHRSAKVCGKGNSASFDWLEKANDAQVRAREVG